MRDLSELERNVSPRLMVLSRQLNLSGDISESYEVENIRRYIRRMLEDAYIQMQNHYAAIVPSIATFPAGFGMPTPRTTPLIVATEEDVYTS